MNPLGGLANQETTRAKRALSLARLERTRSTAMRRMHQFELLRGTIMRGNTPFPERTALIRDSFQIEAQKHGPLIEENRSLAEEWEGKISPDRWTAIVDEGIAKADIASAIEAANAWDAVGKSLSSMLEGIAKELNKLWPLEEITASMERAMDSRTAVLLIVDEMVRLAERALKWMDQGRETMQRLGTEGAGLCESRIHTRMELMKTTKEEYATACNDDATMADFKKRWGESGSDIFIGRNANFITTALFYVTQKIPEGSELRDALMEIRGEFVCMCSGLQKLGNGELGEALSLVFPDFLKLV